LFWFVAGSLCGGELDGTDHIAIHLDRDRPLQRVYADYDARSPGVARERPFYSFECAIFNADALSRFKKRPWSDGESRLDRTFKCGNFVIRDQRELMTEVAREPDQLHVRVARRPVGGEARPDGRRAEEVRGVRAGAEAREQPEDALVIGGSLVIFLGFYIMLQGGKNIAAAGHLDPAVALYAPLILFTVIGLLAVNSANREMGTARSVGVFASIAGFFRKRTG